MPLSSFITSERTNASYLIAGNTCARFTVAISQCKQILTYINSYLHNIRKTRNSFILLFIGKCFNRSLECFHILPVINHRRVT